MNIQLDSVLKEYMNRKHKYAVVLDVATSNTSDIEITEIFLRFASKNHAQYLMEKKQFRQVQTDSFPVLLPHYHLHYEENVTLGMKKWWIFHRFYHTGVKV